MKKKYIKPVSEVVGIQPTTMLAMSGEGTDTNGDHDFGGRGTKERRGIWGNLWE